MRPDGPRQVRDAVRADLATGEYGYDLPHVRRMGEADAMDCLRADSDRVGAGRRERAVCA